MLTHFDNNVMTQSTFIQLLTFKIVHVVFFFTKTDSKVSPRLKKNKENHGKTGMRSVQLQTFLKKQD